MKWSKSDIKEWMQRMIKAGKMFPHPTKKGHFVFGKIK